MRKRLNRAALVRSAFIVCGAVALLALPRLSQAQVVSTGSYGADKVKLDAIRNQTAVSVEPAVKPFSLIDLSKLKWSQSYGVSFGSSPFGTSGFGMYTGSLSYEFSPKLSMQFSMGVAQNIAGSAINSTAELFPSFALDYHPSSKFRLLVNVQRSPYSSGYLNPYNGYTGYNGFAGFGSFGNSFIGSSGLGSRPY